MSKIIRSTMNVDFPKRYPPVMIHQRVMIAMRSRLTRTHLTQNAPAPLRINIKSRRMIRKHVNLDFAKGQPSLGEKNVIIRIAVRIRTMHLEFPRARPSLG